MTAAVVPSTSRSCDRSHTLGLCFYAASLEAAFCSGDIFSVLRVKYSLHWWCGHLCAGIIKLRRSPPPRLRGPQYVLNITATDDNASGGPFPLSSSTQVVVGINDINNNKPVFQEVTERWKAASERFPTAVTHQIVSSVSELQSECRGSGKPATGHARPARPGPRR